MVWRRAFPPVWIVVSACLLTVAGCAVGVNEGGDETTIGGGGFGGGGPATTTASVGGMGVGGEAPGGMGGFGGGGMGGMGGDDPNCVFDAPNTCSTAGTLAAIAGDQNDPPAVQYGVTSKWFQIHILEQVDSIFAEDLSYTVTLTSAPGTQYDLFVHQGPQNGSPNCAAPAKVGVSQGNGVQTVHDAWNDDQGIGGEDDDLWLSIEVRYVSGTACDAAAEWTLEVQGHT